MGLDGTLGYGVLWTTRHASVGSPMDLKISEPTLCRRARVIAAPRGEPHGPRSSELVPMAGLEPARLAPLPPQDSVSTNSTDVARPHL